MKRFFSLTLITFLYFTCSGKTIAVPPYFDHTDTLTKQKAANEQIQKVEVAPVFPGGEKAFRRYIINRLRYPEVAELIGINGKVIVQFVVEKNGSLTNVTPLTCIGAGCESEAADIISGSPLWKPGIQDNKPVRVQYSVPINFNIEKDKVTMKSLRNSVYGFIFEIDGENYTIDDAEKRLGKSISPTQIIIALPYNDTAKFPMPDKKEVFLLKIKT